MVSEFQTELAEIVRTTRRGRCGLQKHEQRESEPTDTKPWRVENAVMYP